MGEIQRSSPSYKLENDTGNASGQKYSVDDLVLHKKARRSSSSLSTMTLPSIESLSIREKSCLRNIGIEPVMLWHGIAASGMVVIVQNFYIDRICRVSDNFTEGICGNLTENTLDEKLVEAGASEYAMYQSLLEYGLPILISLIVGPWTDKNGNKPVILLSLLGYLVSCLLYIFMYYSPQLNPGYILICSVPLAISGGVVTFTVSTYAFMMKQTSDKNRSLRLVILSITWDIGGLIGTLAGAKIYELGGFLSVFTFGAVFYSIAFLYTFIFIEDQVPEQFVDLSGFQSSWGSDFFDTSVLRDMLDTCFKSRQGHLRRWIVILMTGLCLQCLAYSSKTYYQYLYTRNKFGWDTQAYSTYSAANSFLGNVGGTLMVVLLIKMLKMKDIFILTITCVSNLSAYCLFALATAGWQMYLGSGIQMFGTITTAMMRSIMSKCVSKDEHGKLLSFATSIELAMPFLAGFMYGLVYMKTELVFPGAIFFVAMGFTFIILISLIYLYKSMQDPVNYAILIED